MYCSHCGEPLEVDDRFCSSCGTPTGHDGEVEPDEGSSADTSTIAIDIDDDGSAEVVDDLPRMSIGTGMFIVVRGPLSGARFVLDKDVTTIGRHPDAHLLLDDVTVSRHHAEVQRREQTQVLVDMGSLNGTYVGDHRIEEHVLAMGDRVQIGRYKLVYVSGDHGDAGYDQ